MKLVPPTNPVLWTPAEIVVDPIEQVFPNVSDMRTLMRNGQGVGLAAPQVGIPLAFFVWEHGTIINPVIRSESGSKISRAEGCLSFPYRRAFVSRFEIIEAEWMNMRGEIQRARFTGNTARVFQHETDHLRGVCIFPRPTLNPSPVSP